MSRPSLASGPPGVSPRATMHHLIRGLWISRALWVAATLGIADLLQEPKDAAELSHVTGTHGPSLQRVLQALCSVGVLTQDDARRFALTPVGATLRSDAPGSLRAWASMVLGGETDQAWGALMHSVRTGGIAFDHLFGQGVWEYRTGHPEYARLFDDAMTGLTAGIAPAVAEAYDFGAIGTLVDVGGGHGELLAVLLQASPRMRGVVFDLPHVVAGTAPFLTRAGVLDRCDVVGGSFFDGVPGGGDAYILKSIIHDWDDESATAILRSCRRAMSPQSTLLLVERLLPTMVEPSGASETATFSDLNMMVMNGGRERTEAAYRALLEAAGLRHARTVPTSVGFSVVEAVPA